MLRKQISRNAVLYPLFMVALMWFFYLLQNLGLFSGCKGAIIPLTPEGLQGVILSPLLHGNMEHLIGNSLPIVVLLFLLFQFYNTIAKQIFLIGWVATGLLVWLLPPINIFTGEYSYNCIVGASGMVYVLAFFLFFSGIFRWDRSLLTVSLLVALYYGGLIWGVFPEELFYRLAEPSKISWQSHLSGAVIGSLLAFLYRQTGNKKKKYIWEFPNYYNEKDDKLWQEYMKSHPEDFDELPYRKKDEVWDHLEELRRKE